MTLEDLGNIGEFVGAIAVVVSLVYLAVQIRQNTKTVRTATYQSILDASHRVNEYLVDPRIAKLYQLGRKGVSQLPEDELAQFRVLVGQIVSLYEGLFLQHQHGAIDDDFFLGRFDTFHRIICQPGIRAIWEERGRDYYARSFVERVDAMLAVPPED